MTTTPPVPAAERDEARQQVADLRARIEALVRDLDAARADGTIYTYGQVQDRLRALLDDVENPGPEVEHACDNCEGIDPPSCINYPPPALATNGPAPVVHNHGTGLRERAINAVQDAVDGCIDYETERKIADAVLAVVGQDVTAEEDQDGLLPIEREVADLLWQKWRDPDNPAVLIHEDPRTVARHLRPYLRAVVRSSEQGGDDRG